MSKQRKWGVHNCPNGFYYLRDVTNHSVYINKDYGYLYSPYKEDIELVSTLLNELADKVDEQQDTISKLEEEKGYWKSKAMILLMQIRRLTSIMTVKEVIEFSKELEDE